MTPEDLATHVDGILHEETQVTDQGVDVTVSEVHEVTGPGRVDFGGGELADADVTPHERVWRDPDDEYQWWHLDEGQYLVDYNESLNADATVLLQPRDAVVERGAFHPTLAVRRLPCVPLAVPAGGIRLKENARVSTLVPYD